jgi:hypothetical protein
VATITTERTLASEEQAETRPYPPSWFDRFDDWVRGLPIPAWLFYLGVALVLVLIRTIAAWSDGSYPMGTFFPLHILNASSALYNLFVLHYLDDRAGAALSNFRPVLTVDDAEYERLRYQLTTMPARPVLLWSFVGLLFGGVHQPFLIPEAQLQSLKLYTSPAAFAIDSGLSGLNWMMNAVFVYHTIRQLRLVSQIYTRYTHVSIFGTGPLYALSRVTATTTVALLFISYLYLTYWVNWQFQSTGDAVLTIAIGLVAFATFVLPLLGAHRLLQEEKEHRKGEVTQRMEAVTDELHRRVDTHELQGMDALKDALDGLVVEQGLLAKVSTWPWEPEALRAVLTALLLPVILWIITRVLERLLTF